MRTLPSMVIIAAIALSLAGCTREGKVDAVNAGIEKSGEFLSVVTEFLAN